LIGKEREAEVFRVPGYGSLHVIDHVSHTDGFRWHSYLLGPVVSFGSRQIHAPAREKRNAAGGSKYRMNAA
jgi:hypothetical protein